MADSDLNPKRTEDNYAACSAYEDRIADSKHEKHDDVIVFQHRNGLYYFATLDEDNAIALRSEGYPTTGARDNGLKSVLRNREKRARFKITEDRENYYTCLTAGNNQEIGRSCPKKSREAAEALIPPMSAAAIALAERVAADAKLAEEQAEAAAKEAEAQAAKLAAQSEEKEAYVPNAEREQDNYLVCSEYQERVSDSKHAKHEDVIVFQHANGLFYFATVDANNDIALRSEGYPTTGARDNGLKSVLRNREKRTRFKIEENRGLYFTCLTAGNNQEIGRSCPKKSEEAAMAIWPAMSAAALALKAREAEAKAAPPPPEPEPVAETPAPTPVKQPKDDRVVDNYLTCSEYEDRIDDSKHSSEKDFIAFTHSDGLHYFALLDSKGGIALRSEGYASTSARENGIKSVLKNKDIEKRYVIIRKGNKYFTALRAGNHQEIGRSCPKSSEEDAKWLFPTAIAGLGIAAASAAVPEPVAVPTPEEVVAPEPPKEKEDDYLACKEYSGRKVNDTKNNVSLFKHENGQFYFAIVDKEGKVRMRSEGFPDAKRRDEELSGALRFIDDETKYERITRGKYYINVLHDETGREVGRSCASTDEVAFVPPVEKEDDYLACKEYSRRKINDKKNRVSLFKHENGQFYFAILGENDKVRLRSEGFPDAKRRDEELSGALRFIDDESKYTRITQGKYHINVLHDETGREVGRSCAQKEPIPFIPLVAAAAAAIPVAAAVPKPTPAPKKEVAAVAAAATSAAAVPPVAAAASSKGCAPWMWILGALALLGLLYYLLPMGCNGLGCNAPKTTAVAAPKVEAPVVAATPPVTAPVPEPEPVPEPVPVAASCNCNDLTHPVFDIPNRTPRNITRLGTAPEFGNSHSLSPAEFFAKLQRRAANSSADRTFLNGIAKAMGYDSFSDLSGDKFSSVTLERGTTGNLGSTPAHKTIYATLNTSGQDLEAFRIKAANGCDLHFMKTCGNHMFFCPKE